jgi:hypothetical protein
MRKALTFALLAIPAILVLAFVLYEDVPPENPPGYTALSAPVNLNFKITRLNGNRIEMALANPAGEVASGDAMYAVFRVVQVARKRIVALESMSTKSTLKEPPGQARKPDYPFMRDGRGRDVMNFAFENQLTEGPNGELLMRMRYTGVPVPLIETLVVDETVTLPAFIKDRFGSNQALRFEKGSYDLDNQIDGFWIKARRN